MKNINSKKTNNFLRNLFNNNCQVFSDEINFVKFILAATDLQITAENERNYFYKSCN